MNRPFTLLAAAVIIALTGCDARQEINRRAELNRLLKESLLELEAKTAGHPDWGLNKIDDWGFRPGTGEMVFGQTDGGQLVCRAQIIGTFNPENRTWMWAWNSEDFDKSQSEHARLVRDYGEEHRYKRLTEGMLHRCDENDAWALAALAVKLADAQIAYSAPREDLLIFMTIDDVKVEKGTW